MSVNLRFPNITAGTEKEQLAQIKSYLHQLVEQLNYALPTIGEGASAPSIEVQGGEMSYYELRSLIIQNLHEVELRFEQLSGKVEADIEETLTEAKESGEFDGPQGPQGIQGPKGADGFSPIVEVTDIDGGHRVTITDATSTRSFDVLDGNGSAGDDINADASGTVISLYDAANARLKGLTIYGKTTQNGTPTPSAPVPLNSVGDSGSLVLTVTNANNGDEQTMQISTPNGLRGIPVSSGGNYTDANGQQWICDEVDFVRGVYVQRVGEKAFGSWTWKLNGTVESNNWRFGASTGIRTATTLAVSTHFQLAASVTDAHTKGSGFLWYTNGYVEAVSTEHKTADEFNAWNKENRFTVYYALEFPIETPLSAEEMAAYRTLHTYKPKTTVFNDAGAYMELEYQTNSEISVTDSGIDGGWSYKKWNNGTYEMFGEFAVTTTTICTDMGSMFCSEEFSLPTPFSIDGAIVSGSADDLFLVASGGRASVDADTNIGFVLLRPFSFDANLDIIVRLHVTGTYHQGGTE